MKRHKYTKRQVIEIIKQFHKEKGVVPRKLDFDTDYSLPSTTILRNYFGGLDNALKETGLWEKRYNPTHSCDRCGKSFDDIEKSGRSPIKEYDNNGNWTGRWDCNACWQKYDPNGSTVLKKVADSRTGNLDISSQKSKGDIDIDVICKLYGYIDLNKKYDNHITPIDCLDEKTELLYQVRGICYDPINKRWEPNDLEREWYKEYEDMIIVCKNKNGNIIERIYRFPLWIIIGEEIKRIGIYKYRTSELLYENGWYEDYRVSDEEVIKANEILSRILLEEEDKKL